MVPFVRELDLAGHQDPLAAGGWRGALEHRQNRVHSRPELRVRQEQVGPDRREHVSDVLDRAEILERVQVGGERRAGQHATEDIDDERNRRSLRAAKGQDRAGQRFIGIRRRKAVRIDRPAFGNPLPSHGPPR